jgi:hypothetical protein
MSLSRFARNRFFVKVDSKRPTYYLTLFCKPTHSLVISITNHLKRRVFFVDFTHSTRRVSIVLNISIGLSSLAFMPIQSPSLKVTSLGVINFKPTDLINQLPQNFH